MVTVAISCYRGPAHTWQSSDIFSDRGLLLPSVATGVQHTSVKSGGGLVTLFSDS